MRSEHTERTERAGPGAQRWEQVGEARGGGVGNGSVRLGPGGRCGSAEPKRNAARPGPIPALSQPHPDHLDPTRTPSRAHPPRSRRVPLPLPEPAAPALLPGGMTP